MVRPPLKLRYDQSRRWVWKTIIRLPREICFWTRASSTSNSRRQSMWSRRPWNRKYWPAVVELDGGSPSGTRWGTRIRQWRWCLHRLLWRGWMEEEVWPAAIRRYKPGTEFKSDDCNYYCVTRYYEKKGICFEACFDGSMTCRLRIVWWSGISLLRRKRVSK